MSAVPHPESRPQPTPELNGRLDEAARAGWLYYIAGKTQDDIARTLNVSRPTAQRLVSLCRAEGLITFRINHAISACMSLAAALRDRHGLVHCDVVPSDGSDETSSAGAAEACAIVIERMLRATGPLVIGLGTGRAMRASVARVAPTPRPLHRVVSLVGTISPDGSASRFNAPERLAELTGAQHFPLPLPMHATTAAQREQLLALDPVRRIFAMAQQADAWFSGLSQFDDEAVLYRDGFIRRDELLELMRVGAVGENLGWAFDANGRILDEGLNARVTSVPLAPGSDRLRVCVAHGPAKVAALRAALTGRIVNGLITDEPTARAVLGQ
ncbi:MAG: sugar-binding transcriptional regulator [Burkholderiales bacterium]|nr:sugar-binding transcriptional regulator [Burkholderiales bacterium]